MMIIFIKCSNITVSNIRWVAGSSLLTNYNRNAFMYEYLNPCYLTICNVCMLNKC